MKVLLTLLFLFSFSSYGSEEFKNWGIGGRLGFVLTNGPATIDNNTSTEAGKGLFLDYIFDSGFGLEFAYDRLDFGKTSGRVEHFGFMGTYRYRTKRFKPFLGLGFGIPELKLFDNVDSDFTGELSFIIKGGIEWDITRPLKMMAGVQHYSFGTDGQFSDKFSILMPMVGISYHFDVDYQQVGHFFVSQKNEPRFEELKEEEPIKPFSPPKIDFKIYYDFEQWKVSEKHEEDLLKLVTFLRDNPFVFIEIQGHSDNMGPSNWNQELSFLRAKAVYDTLVERFDIAKERLYIKGMGASKPEASNDNRDDRAKNRRVEVEVIQY